MLAYNISHWGPFTRFGVISKTTKKKSKNYTQNAYYMNYYKIKHNTYALNKEQTIMLFEHFLINEPYKIQVYEWCSFFAIYNKTVIVSVQAQGHIVFCTWHHN